MKFLFPHKTQIKYLVPTFLTKDHALAYCAKKCTDKKYYYV